MSAMFIALVVGYLLFSLSWLLFSLVFIIPKLRHRNFPGPHYRSFLFGNAADFIAHPGEAHLVLQRYRARFGKTFQFYALQRRIVAVTDPDDVKFVLATKALPKAEAFNASVGAFSRDGLLTVPEERHMKQRRAISGRFNDDFLRSLHVQTSAALEEFAGILGDAAESGAVIDFDEMVTRLALDVILRCAFGARIGQIQSADARSKHPLPAAIAKGLNECFKNLGMYPYRMYLTSQKPLKKAMKFISGFCQEIIDERRANPKSDDGVDDLLDIFMNIPGATDDYIIGEVSTFLIAGHDTTSHSLAFLFYELCKHPEIKQKMLEEIDLKMTDPKQTIPAFEDIAEVPYIRAVWKETLRLHPVAATGTMRTATENIILPSSKLVIEKGCDVLVPPYVIHHLDEVWPDASSFKPERFIHPSVRPHPYAFQGFSAGTRNCIGQFFATHEAVTVIMSTMRQFDVELACRPDEIKEFHAVTMKPRYVKKPKDGPPVGLPVRIKKRI